MKKRTRKIIGHKMSVKEEKIQRLFNPNKYDLNN